MSSTRKTSQNNITKFVVVCLALILGCASTGYGDIILGNWETGMDGWAKNDATVAEPCLGVGNTLGSYSLKVDVPSGWHMAINRDSGLLSAIATATTIQVDITLKASEWVIGSGWVKPIENLVLQDDMSSWQQLNPIGGSVGWDGASDQTFTVTFNIPAQTGTITWATLIIVTNYDGVTTAGNFYFDNVRIATPDMTVSKCNVTAGKTQAWDQNDVNNMKDTFTVSGSVQLPDDLNDINTVGFKITSVTDDYLVYTEDLNDFNGTTVNKKHKYTHSAKLTKGQPGKITSLTLDFRKGTFAITGQNLDLTGLTCPLELKITLGSNELKGSVAEVVVNGTKTIPTRLMRLYKNTLIVPPGKTKVKSGTKPSSDSLSVTGEIAVEDINTTDPNLYALPVDITWCSADDTNCQNFRIPPHSFKIPKTGHAYTLNKNINPSVTPVEEPNARISGTIDLDKCTFSLSITKADINAVSGLTKFGISFDTPHGDFDEANDVNLAWKK